MNYSKHSNNKQIRKTKAKTEKVTNTFSALVLRAIVVLIIVAGFMSVGVVFGAYMGVVESSPELTFDEVSPNSYTSIIYDASGKEIDRLHGDENREYAKLSEIPKNLQNAVIAVEDVRFYQHNGIDFRGMARALYINVKEKSFSEGASTITQQLIKNNILKDTSKKLRRKLQEQYIAIEYEKALEKALGSKERAKAYVLELYLNSIALGHGNNGVKAAAKYYFEKDLGELTLSECAVIAAITNNPSMYSPKSDPEQNDLRKTKILENMLEEEMITKAEFDKAIDEDVYSKVAGVFAVEKQQYQHSYFVDQLINDIAEDLVVRKNKTLVEAYNIIYSGGLTINTTQDMAMQTVMDEKFKDDTLFPTAEFEYKVTYYLSVINKETGETSHHEKVGYIKSLDDLEDHKSKIREELMKEGDEVLAEREEVIPEPQAAMVIMDFHNGHVKALTGGRGDKTELDQRPLNRSTQSNRQPGSVFKVLTTYAPGVDTGKLAAATVIEDKAVKIGSWEFHNWWGSKYKGPMTVRKAVEQSANLVTVRALTEYVGFQTSWDYLMNFGFTTLVEKETRRGTVYSDMNASSALGGITDGVSVMELTGAYGTIANEGVYNKPILYTTVLDHNGQLLLDNTSNTTREVMKKQAAYIVTDMLKDVITGSAGTGHLAKFQNVKMPVYGKTGTTSDDKDLVFAGYTPYYVSAIWMGHDMPKKMSYTSSPHLRLWRSIMEEIHQDLEYKTFERPDGIVSGTVCSKTGKLPGEECPTITDMFLPGTIPSEVCDGIHPFDGDEKTKVLICLASGLRAGEFCPQAETEEKEFGISYDDSGEIHTTAPEGVCNIHTSAESPTDQIPDWLDTNPETNHSNNSNGGGGIPPTQSFPDGQYIWNSQRAEYEWVRNPDYVAPSDNPDTEDTNQDIPSALDNFDFSQ